jgi:hypothetical protein
MSPTLRICIAIAGCALLAILALTDSAVIPVEPTAVAAIMAAATDTKTPADASSTCGDSCATTSATSPVVPGARERTTLTGSGTSHTPAAIDAVLDAD